MSAHVTFSCSMPQEMAAAMGWRGAADVAMLGKVRSGPIDADQTWIGRTWLGCARLREDDRRDARHGPDSAGAPLRFEPREGPVPGPGDARVKVGAAVLLP